MRKSGEDVTQGALSSKDENNSSSSNSSSHFAEGDRVEAKCGNWKKYYPGKIETVNGDGTVNILFLDGDRRENVSPSCVKKAGPSVSVNDIVKCQFRGKTQWYNAQVKAVHADGTCDIVYLDDKTEDHLVPAERIKFLRRGSTITAGPAKPELSQLVLQSRVDATHPDWVDENGENPRYYPAAVVKMRNMYTYDVEFFDGDEMHGLAIPRENIRPVVPCKGSLVCAKVETWKKN